MTAATSLLLFFFLALIFSRILTPLVRMLGISLGAMDIPLERKVHTTPIPRIGGVAIFLAFVATMVLASLYLTRVSELLVNQRTAFGL
jgi:UDP-GlcNAc:undecaprenyl-phosphate GlcNAc-1-phosphate transferase